MVEISLRSISLRRVVEISLRSISWVISLRSISTLNHLPGTVNQWTNENQSKHTHKLFFLVRSPLENELRSNKMNLDGRLTCRRRRAGAVNDELISCMLHFSKLQSVSMLFASTR